MEDQTEDGLGPTRSADDRPWVIHTHISVTPDDTIPNEMASPPAATPFHKTSIDCRGLWIIGERPHHPHTDQLMTGVQDARHHVEYERTGKALTSPINTIGWGSSKSLGYTDPSK